MLYIKFKLLIINLIFLSTSYASFSDMDCLKANFETTIEHKSAPFGLLKRIIKIKKEKCVLIVEHEKLKFLKNKWIIDVCRSPIHIKVDTGSIDVTKRLGNCSSGQSDNYCNLLGEIEARIQDDGLIFASGGKEDISSAHGKVYCASLLVDAHLREGLIFDWTSNYSQILNRKSFKGSKPSKISGHVFGEGKDIKLTPAEF